MCQCPTTRDSPFGTEYKECTHLNGYWGPHAPALYAESATRRYELWLARGRDHVWILYEMDPDECRDQWVGEITTRCSFRPGYQILKTATHSILPGTEDAQTDTLDEAVCLLIAVWEEACTVRVVNALDGGWVEAT